jgi:hypothetical protein
MEMTMTILMVLGIFVGIPVLVGLAIAGTLALTTQKARQQVKPTAKARIHVA